MQALLRAEARSAAFDANVDEALKIDAVSTMTLARCTVVEAKFLQACCKAASGDPLAAEQAKTEIEANISGLSKASLKPTDVHAALWKAAANVQKGQAA